MQSYPHEIPSSRLDSAVSKSKIAESLSGGRGDDLDCGQQSLRLQTGNPYSRTLFRYLIATTSLAVITVLFWLSLIGFAPSVYAHGAARTSPTEQSTSATTSSKHQR
jgi:hypothetical protein